MNKLVQTFYKNLSDVLFFSTEGDDRYNILITSSKIECQLIIIDSLIRSFIFRTGIIPHIILHELDDNFIIKYCKHLQSINQCNVSFIKVNDSNINYLIKQNTCFISSPMVSDMIGFLPNINNISKISKLKNRKIPIYSDLSYAVGKIDINIFRDNIDAFSIDFGHILSSSSNVCVLAIKSQLLTGYGMDDSYLDSIFHRDISKYITSIKLVNSYIKSVQIPSQSDLSKYRTIVFSSLSKFFKIYKNKNKQRSSSSIIWLNSDIQTIQNNIILLISSDEDKSILTEKISKVNNNYMTLMNLDGNDIFNILGIRKKTRNYIMMIHLERSDNPEFLTILADFISELVHILIDFDPNLKKLL